MDKDIFTVYGDDKIQYKKFDNAEAVEIIIPTEVNYSVRKKPPAPVKTAPKKRATVSEFLDFAEALGAMYIGAFKAIVRTVLPIVLLPFKGVAALIRLISNFLHKFKDQKLRRYLKESDTVSGEIKAIRLKAMKQDDENKTVYFFKAVGTQLSDYLLKDDRLVKSACNYLLPFAVLMFIISGALSTQNKIPALKIMYNGMPIAYAENQQIWNEGKSKALSMIYSDTDAGEIFDDITFEIDRVKPSQLNSPQVISESLLASSSTTYKRVCGIYIDGELLCATHNESDALAVLDSILAPYEKKADENTIVGFVEEIEYVQGYYPENSDIIWDTAKLMKTLKSSDSPVRVKTMKTVTRYETVKYDTVKKNTSTLYKGTKKTLQKGKNGKMLVTELVTYIGSKKTYTATVSEKIVTEPVDEIVQIGTKSNAYGGSSSSATGFIWPTRGAYSVSSHYGYRSASISGWSYHGGIDIVLGYGSSAGIPVVAAASGTVVTANSGWRGYGHTVVIDHGNGIKTRYAHMYPGSIAVRVGQKVYQGQQIGRIGSTGNSTGPHLHFEMLIGGRKVNPYPYIR